MNRRDAGLALLLGRLAIGAAPFAARAQQAGKVYRIGYLSTPTRESVEHGVPAILRRLRELLDRGAEPRRRVPLGRGQRVRRRVDVRSSSASSPA